MKKMFMVGIGWEQIPMVIKAKNKGLYVIATTEWQNKDLIPADKVYEIGSRDLTALEEAFLFEKPDCIISDECDYSMYAVAFLAEKYKLAGPSLRTQTITNNKFLQRECIAKLNILQPDYGLCIDKESAKKTAEIIGYPVMIKPVDNRGSIGVSRVDCEKDLDNAWYLAVENSHSRLCLVEKCIIGNIITSEGFYDSKKYEFIASSTKEMYEKNENLARAVYYPGILEKNILLRIKAISEKVVKAIGINYGFVHLEFIIEKDSQEIYFVEAANRGGGVFISNIILEEITGIDFCGAILDMAMGKSVDINFEFEYIRRAMIYFFNMKGKENIKNINISNTKCKAIFLNTYRRDANVSKEGAIGRQGAAVFSGNDFVELGELGEKIEKTYCQSSTEYFKLNL